MTGSLVSGWKPLMVMTVAAVMTSFQLGCSQEVSGPEPSAEEPTTGEDLPVDPAVICRQQLTTDVVITGENFSPVPIDVPHQTQIALPDVSLVRARALDGSDLDAGTILFSGSPDTDRNVDLLSWQSQTQMTLTINQEIEFPGDDVRALGQGLYDVVVQNPNENEVEIPGALAAISQPELAEPTPGILCATQSDRQLVLNGQSFLDLEETLGSLDVDGGGSFAIDEVRDCTEIPHEGVDARLCTEGELTLPQGFLDEGYPELIVNNPETAACSSRDNINLRVVPPPEIDRVAPPLACVAEEDRQVVIEGAGFLRIDGQIPNVTIGDVTATVSGTSGCASLETMGHEVETCDTIIASIASGSLGAGDHEVVVTNPDPAGCSGSASAVFTVVPPPDVSSVDPVLVCVNDGERAIEVQGSDFLTIDGTVPEVMLGDVVIDPSRVAAQNCQEVAVNETDVTTCSSLLVTIAQDELSAGNHDVSVRNPDPAGCSDTEPELLSVVEGPSLTEAAPALACAADGSRDIVLTGSFLQIESELPAVQFNGTDATVSGLSDCSEAMVNGLNAQRCNTLTATALQGSLGSGAVDVTITDPAPAGCSSTNSEILIGPPALALTSAAPSSACDNTGNHLITVTGTGFLRTNDTDFTVRIDGTTVTPESIGGCSDVTVPDDSTVQSCTTFDVTVSSDSLAVGSIPIEVENPAPSGCAATTSEIFQITNPPTVSSVASTDSEPICSDVSTQLTLTGSEFVESSTVFASDGATDYPADTVTFVSASELTVTFDNGLPAGSYSITVDNGAGGTCSSTLDNAFEVDPTPIVFFVDPPVLYNSIAIEATIFTSGLSTTATDVAFVDTYGTSESLTFSSPDRPNRILAQVPADTFAAGEYEVRVTSTDGCVGTLPGGVTITDSETLDLASATPQFYSPTEPTAVTLRTNDPITAGSVGFEATPRVYLNPVGGAYDDGSDAE